MSRKIRYGMVGGGRGAFIGAVHRIANEGPDVAVSLHVYGTGADRISTGVNRLIA